MAHLDSFKGSLQPYCRDSQNRDEQDKMDYELVLKSWKRVDWNRQE